MKALILFFFFITNVQAEILTLNPGVIKLNVPKDWESANKLYGVQLMLAGPMKGDRRPIITIESTVLDYKFNVEELKKDQGSYRTGRLQWLHQRSGKAISFLPYKVQKLSGNLEDHVVGYEYEIDNEKYLEMSHYIPCKKTLMNLKVLIPHQQKASALPQVEGILKSFECLKGKN